MKTESSPEARRLAETEAEVDPVLGEILESYLTALEQGTPADRDAFLARHPEHAEHLAQYLPWVELLYQAKPREQDSAANPPMPRQLGDFRITREIGRGGMGIVYEAEQISLKRRVALKLLPFASMLDERQLARFKNEALAAAQLHHPNIVPVFAVGCEHGLHFYVMQLIEGQTLEQFIHDSASQPTEPGLRNSTVRVASEKTNGRASVPPDRCRTFAEWIAQAADALEHAHEQGIVHRDVKPSNLMVSSSGEVWVTDFGLARTQHDASMTVTGELLGTLRYMSPEQLRSKPGFVDHRTDIHSLGLTLYELIAKRPGFEGQTQQELIRQIENDDPPSLLRVDARVPRDLDSIVQKAISKAPEGRYASARDLADDLRAFLDGRPTMARPATWRDHAEKWVRRHARLAASVGIALAVIMLCAVASAVLVWRARGETQQALVLANDNHLRAEQNLQDARRAVDDLFTGVATDLAEVPGAESVRRHLLNQALAYYQRFAQQAATNPSVRAETAAAYYRCGQISEQLGDDESARAAYENAKQIWSELHADQDDPDALRSLGLCENNLGLIHLRAGRGSQAEAHLHQAVALQQQLAASKPGEADVQRALALGYANLGMALGQAGRLDEARDAVRQALALHEKAGATTSRARGDLAATYNQLGFLYSTQSIAESETAYRRAADEFAQLSKDEPRVAWWQAQLATTLNNLAALAAGDERLDEAEAQYRRAIGIQQQLAASAPQVVAYVRDLAVSQNNLGYLLSRHDRHEGAIEQFQGARDNLLALARAHQRSPEYASRLGAVCNNLGLAYENQQALDRAEAAFSEAIEWQRKALELSPGWQQAAAYLDAHTDNLLRILKATHQDDAAKDLENRQQDARHEAKTLSGQATPPAAQATGEIAPPEPPPAAADPSVIVPADSSPEQR